MSKILVTFASRSGSTAEIAQEIGRILSENGAQVDVLPMKDVNDPALYRAVVIGSPIHGSKWLPEAVAFVRQHQAILSQKPLAMFTVCITLAMANTDQYRSSVATWVAPVSALVKPMSQEYFAGLLDFSKLPFTLNTLILRVVVAFGVFPRGDRRDWVAIRAWAQELSTLLAA